MLTDATIRKAKWRPPLTEEQKKEKREAAQRGEKPIPDNKLSDGKGLFLQLTPAGGKLWRFRYRVGGTEKLLSFGAYPDVSLAAAREKRDQARKRIAAGEDPAVEKRLKKTGGGTFRDVASEWLDAQKSVWSASHAVTVERRLEHDLLPYLGSRPVGDITPPELLQVLRKAEGRGAKETARRLRQVCGMIFRYAVATGRAQRDPSADLRGALAPVAVQHRAAVTDPGKLGELLRAIEGYPGSITVKTALRLAPHVFVRPGELRKMEWSEINWDAAQWIIPSWKTKMRRALIVPLTTQTIALLREIQPVTGDSRFVFPSARSAARPMSDAAVNAAFRRMGYEKDEVSGHGFRATARTILDEVLHERPDLIEAQLNHDVKDPLGRAYHRATYLAERVEMMERWSSYLTGLRASKPEAKEA